MLIINNINKSFGNTVACSNVNLQINQGEFFFILGPSGCGKSTLLKIIAGLLQQDSGELVFEGILYKEIPAYERPFNMVFQNYSLFPHLSVFNNVAFGLKMNNTSKDEIKAKVAQVLSLFQINELSQRKPDQLSGGEQQRVALARAIVNNPKVLLLDEPLSALDEKLRVEMQQTLKELKSKLNTTFIYVTHNQEEALSMGDRIAIMNKGQIEDVSTPKDIYYTPSTRFIAEFLGEINILGYRTEYFEDSMEKSILFHEEKDFLAFNPLLLKNREIQIIRPENISIGKSPFKDASYTDVKTGVVVQRLFKGNTMTYLVKCADGSVMKATDFNTGSVEHFLTNNEVYIGWKSSEIRNVKA